MPIIRRQPKLGGFRSPQREEYEVVNVGSIEKTLEAGTYDIDALKKAHLLRRGKRVKLLANGSVKKKFTLTVHAASQSAVEAVEKAGGKVTVL